MATYPTYKRQLITNANIAAPSNIDFAATRESIRGANQTKEAAARVTNFALRKYDESMQFTGAQAGAEAPQETLKSMRGSTPVTTFDQAAYAAAVQVGSVQIEAEARETFSKLHLDAKKNKTPPDVLQSQIQSVIDGYGSSLNDLAPLAAEKLQARLSGLGRGIFLDRSDDYLKEQQKILDGKAVSLFDSYVEQAARLGSGNSATKEKDHTKLREDLTENLKLFGTDPVKIQRSLIQLSDSFYKSRVFNNMERAQEKGTLPQYLKKFKADARKGAGLAKGLTTNQIQSHIRSVNVRINNEGVLQRRAAASLKKELTAAENILEKGGNVSDSDLEQLSNVAKGLGDGQLVKAAEDLQALQAGVKDITNDGLSAIDTYANMLEARRNRDKLENKTTDLFNLKLEKLLRRSATAVEQKILKDPLGFSYGQKGQLPPRVDVFDVDSLKEHFAEVAEIQLFNGVPVTHVGKQLADSLKPLFASQNLNDLEGQTQVLQNIATAVGPQQASNVFKHLDIGPDSRELSNVTVLGNVDLTREYLIGRFAFKEGARLDEIAEKKQDFDLGFGKAFSKRPADAAALFDASIKIGIARGVAQENSIPKSDKMLADIQHELVGGSTNNGVEYGGFVEADSSQGGQVLILPSTMKRNKAALEERMDNLQPEDIGLAGAALIGDPDDLPGVFPIYETSTGPKPMQIEDVRDATLMPYLDGRYFIKVRGISVVNNLGEPYVLDLR